MRNFAGSALVFQQKSAGKSACATKTAVARSFCDAGHFREDVKDHREVAFHVTHASGGGEKLVGYCGGGQRHVQVAPHLQGQQHVLLHHVDVEPRFLRHFQNEGATV